MVQMTKLLSIALVAIMALGVVSTAGIIAAPKTAARLPPASLDSSLQTGIEPIIIQYQAGKTYTFIPKQYNEHSAQFTPYVGTPVHNEFANGGTTLAIIHSKAQAGAGETNIGTLFQLDGGYDTWTTVWNKPCKVIMTVHYTLTAKGDAHTRAFVEAYLVNPRGVVYAEHTTVYGHDKTAVKTGTIRLEYTGIVDDILHYIMAEPSLVQGAAYTHSFVGQDGSNSVATTGHASATTYTSSITISFLEA